MGPLSVTTFDTLGLGRGLQMQPQGFMDHGAHVQHSVMPRTIANLMLGTYNRETEVGA